MFFRVYNSNYKYYAEPCDKFYIVPNIYKTPVTLKWLQDNYNHQDMLNLPINQLTLIY